MIVGIVGNEEAKFTPLGEDRANAVIVELLERPGVTEVVSGGCHLGGIDKWAIQIGEALGLVTTEFLPEQRTWEFFKKRNLQIVDRSNEVHCIVVDQLPEWFSGMRFPLCYHCRAKDHVKSGGCYTMKQAIARGKVGKLHVVKNF
jgi:hypothetical protein